MKAKHPLKDENGFVLLVALIMLAMCTLLGIWATTTSTTEIQIAQNERIYKDNLYRSEAAAMESAQRLENGGNAMADTSSFPAWLHDDSDPDVDPYDITDASWNGSDSQPSVITGSRFLVVFEGIPAGESVGESGSSKVYAYRFYGQSTRYSGKATLEGGYKSAF